MSRIKSHRRRSSDAGSKDLFLAIVFGLFGLIFSLVGAGMAWSSWSVVSVAQRAEGTVIRQVRQEQPVGQMEQVGMERSVAPVVEFFVGGERHEFQSGLSTSPPQFDVGDKVTVLYDPQDLAVCRIDSFVTLWLFPAIFGGIGVVLLTIIGILIVTRWFRASASPPTDENANTDGTSSVLDERAGE